MRTSRIRAMLGVSFVVTLAVVAALLSPAQARAYNNGNYNYTTGQDSSQTVGNAGWYQRYPVDPVQIRSFSGPHGGYTTTTNKCADCHAVHRARGTLLLRGKTMADACTFCHQGGGGSSTNIQMDNAYDETGIIDASPGNGVGHTVGYTGNAPGDIRPAYRSGDGLLCFTCHSPHAASTRVLATFADPGRPLGDEWVSTVWQGSQVVSTTPSPTGIDLSSYAGGIGDYWGTTIIDGNIATVSDGRVEQLAVFPKGRFLLVKDPHSTPHETEADTVVGSHAGSDGQSGYNKIAIDWEDPLGPADASIGRNQDTDNDTPYFGGTGLATVSEFCTDCHDGNAGAVSQLATVWRRDTAMLGDGEYIPVRSHDSQPRDVCRAQLLDPAGTEDNPDGTDDNYGPSCRQCHAGGASCRECHGTDDFGVPKAAYTTDPLAVDGKTSLWPQASIARSAVASLSGQCIDGGFSWPHRTLAVDMLQDEIYGVDFDGTPVAAGERRSNPETLVAGYLDGQQDATEPTATGWQPFVDPEPTIANAVAENIDSACITCHGQATYWNGDDPAFHHSTPDGSGWDLLLKGLP